MVMERVRAWIGAVGTPWADVESDLDSNGDGEIGLADKLADELAGD